MRPPDRIKSTCRKADTGVDGERRLVAHLLARFSRTRPGSPGRGGFALSEFSLTGLSLTGPAGMTPVGWLAALGLTAVLWWVLYRAFHAMTVADEASSEVAHPQL